jgi:hypothetical protein
VSPRTSTRDGDGSKKSHDSTSPIHSSPLGKEIPQTQSGNPNLNASKEGQGDIKGERSNSASSAATSGISSIGGAGKAAVPAILGGRTTQDSMPVHRPSQGFREGGERGITKIDEKDEGV